LLSVSKKERKKDANDYEPPRPIYNPNALPMFAEKGNSKRKISREATNPKRHAQLDSLKQTQNAMRATSGGSVSQYMAKNFLSNEDFRAQDPREALLKYAKVAEEDPYFFAVYKKTQPVTKFTLDEENQEEQKKEEKK
jgi:WD repeat-containing protein 70